MEQAKRTKKRYGICAYCGNSRKLTKDHVIPKSKGGQSNPLNIVDVCSWCNQSKAELFLDAWIKTLSSREPQWQCIVFYSETPNYVWLPLLNSWYRYRP